MTSFFYVFSIPFHTSVPALQKCMDTSRKSLLAESATTRALPAAPHLWTWKTCLLSPLWSKDVKITWGEVWRVRWMWKTLEGQILDCCNSWTGSMGPSIVMLQQNTCTQKSTLFGLDCRMQVILEDICICWCSWWCQKWVFVLVIKTDVDTLQICMVKIRNHKEDREWEGKVNDISQTSVLTTVQSLQESMYTNTAQRTHCRLVQVILWFILLPSSILSLWSWRWKQSVSLLPFTVGLGVCSIHLFNYTIHIHNF
jgi:hypothetical protein